MTRHTRGSPPSPAGLPWGAGFYGEEDSCPPVRFDHHSLPRFLLASQAIVVARLPEAFDSGPRLTSPSESARQRAAGASPPVSPRDVLSLLGVWGDRE